MVCLPEVENFFAVGIENVIGLGDCFESVGLTAKVTTYHPYAACLAFAVADVKSFANRAPVGLTASFQFAASLTTIKIGL